MHNQNEAFLHLNDALPADIARRRDMGDLAGALRLIDARLSSGVQPLLAPRLEAERLRLTRLPYDYPYTRPEAVALVRAEWPGFTEAQFDALLDGGRIDWRMVDGELRVHREFLESLRIYPKEAPGLVHEAVDNAERDAVLARMEREGSLTARITLKADIRALVPVAGQHPRRGGRAGVCTTAHHVVENKRRGGVLRHLPLPLPGGVHGSHVPLSGAGAAGL